MTKQDMVKLILSHPRADRQDRALARQASTTRRQTAKLALVNITRRLAAA